MDSVSVLIHTVTSVIRSDMTGWVMIPGKFCSTVGES